jgi:hypothetical protein
VIQTAIAVLGLSLLGHEQFTIREWGEAVARRAQPTLQLIDSFLARCEDPEAAWRLSRMRKPALVRECDRLAREYGGYPAADTLGWPTDPHYWWSDAVPPKPEFWCLGPIDDDANGPCMGYVMRQPTEEEQCERTRAALCLYAHRTSDWATVRYYLSRRSWRAYLTPR